MDKGPRQLTENKWVRWGAVVAWMGAIFFLSAQPQLPQVTPPFLISFQDVIGHFTAYGILGALLYWALAASGVERPAPLVMLLVLLYALSDEFHQSFVPNRHPDPFDIATDLVGAGVAVLLLNLRRSLQNRRRPR